MYRQSGYSEFSDYKERSNLRSLRWRFRHGKRARYTTKAKATQMQNDVLRRTARAAGNCVPPSSIPGRLRERGIGPEDWTDRSENSSEFRTVSVAGIKVSRRTWRCFPVINGRKDATLLLQRISQRIHIQSEIFLYFSGDKFSYQIPNASWSSSRWECCKHPSIDCTF